MVPHTPPFVDGDMSAGNLVTAEWLNWVNERVTDTERFLGFFDASSGDLPPVVYPAAVYLSGDNYEISVAGTLDLVDPATLLSGPTLANVGDFIRWVYNSPTNPDGWYHVVPVSTIIASNVGFTPTAGIAATNVQDAIEELEAEAVLLVDLIAANVGYTPSGDLVATNVQAALDELEAEKAPLSAGTAVGTSFSPVGAVTATDVQDAIEQLLVIAEAGGGGGGYAVSIINVPSGNISSTNVQAALNELDTEKVAKAGDTMTGDLIGPDANFDRFFVGRYVGPGAGNYTLNADGLGAMTIVDDTTFSLTLKSSGSILTSPLTVGGTSAPNANAGLDLQGIKPMLLPRLTTAQRTAVTGVEGMFCFDTDLDTAMQYTGAAWTGAGAGTQVTSLCMACSDEGTALTTGTAKITFRMPYAMTLTAVRASLTTAQASGSIFTVDINEGNVSILSTKLTIDNNERTSTTAVTAPVISDTALANDAEITVDIDQIGTSGATGLKVYLIGTI